MSNPVIILEGIFWYKEHVLCVGSKVLEEALAPYVGRKVSMAVHHWPDSLLNYCFLGSCEQHDTNKGFLFSWNNKGVLEDFKTVNNSVVPIDKLIGHHCRVVLVLEDFEIPQPESENVFNEAQKLTELLESLRQSLEELK